MGRSSRQKGAGQVGYLWRRERFIRSAAFLRRGRNFETISDGVVRDKFAVMFIAATALPSPAVKGTAREQIPSSNSWLHIDQPFARSAMMTFTILGWEVIVYRVYRVMVEFLRMR